MILLRLSPIICSRDIFGLSRDLEFVSRDLEGISGGRGLIWRGDCVWWFLWFDWLKPLKNMFYFKASGPAKFYRSRSASQYSSPLRYIRYPQSSFETFACSIQTSSSGFHRARVIPLNNLLSVWDRCGPWISDLGDVSDFLTRKSRKQCQYELVGLNANDERNHTQQTRRPWDELKCHFVEKLEM